MRQNRIRSIFAFGASAITALLTASAGALPIQIDNHSFEVDPASNGTFPTGPVTDWPPYDPFNLLPLSGNVTGVINPTGTTFFNGDAPDGSNAALLFVEGSVGQGVVGIRQILDAVVVPGSTYTLTVEVGNIASGIGLPPFDSFGFYDLDGFPGYSIQLLANGVVLAEDYNSLSIPEGEFVTATTSVSIPLGHFLEGIPLEIRLLNLNFEDSPADPGIEVDFDDVRLDVTPTQCNQADLSEPFGLLDLADISAFTGAFLSGDLLADLDNSGTLDLADVNTFVQSFTAGCP